MTEARSVGDLLEIQGAESISGPHGVLDAPEPVPGRKHLILISAGVPFSSRPGRRPDLRLETLAVGRRAAAANVNLHVFYMNVHFMLLFSAEYAGKRDAQLFEDIGLFASGLESVAEHAGGAFHQVEVDADPFIGRFSARRRATTSWRWRPCRTNATATCTTSASRSAAAGCPSGIGGW